jgi:adenosylcobinamide-GDP ribazoletransferase
VIPTGGGTIPPSEAELAASRFAFPVVGLFLGLAFAAASEGLRLLNAASAISAALLVTLTVAATGGLHLDGVADTSDGLLMPRGDAGRRLDVMREPHVGSFGVISIVLVLLVKSAAVASLPAHERSCSLLAAAVASRSLVLVAAGTSNPARNDGIGRLFIVATTLRDATLGILLVCGCGIFASPRMGPGAAIAALSVTFLITRLATGRLGGITGDVLGAVVEAGETVFLAVLALAAPA